MGFMKNKFRHLFLGLMLALCSIPALAFDAMVGQSPDNSQALTLSAIQSAQKSIYLNIYMLTAPVITDALIAKIQAGVYVEVLIEGEPVGGLSAHSKTAEDNLVQAMQSARSGHFFVMTTKGTGGKRRYVFDHAKYAVIDSDSLLIDSDNFTSTGVPNAGVKGTRGWVAFLHDPSIAQEYMNIFREDATTSHGDVEEVTSNSSPAPMKRQPKPPVDNGNGGGKSGGSGGVSGESPESVTIDTVQRISSPDTSLSGLLAAINGARQSIDLEQMTFDSEWNGGSSPLLDAVIAAARRGVQVRVLLNDDAHFANNTQVGSQSSSSPNGKTKNQPTADKLNQLAASEGLKLEAKIGDDKAMDIAYIHNKGMLIDKDQTLISSINWDYNAVTNNREAAVLLTSTSAHAHYESLFEKDWQVSGGKAAPNSLTSKALR